MSMNLRISSIIAAILSTAFALPAVAEDPTPYTLPTGSTRIECSGSPFGKRLTLGIDQEVVITRRQSGTANSSPLVNYQLSGALGTTVERQLSLTALDNNTALDTVRVDLDGDGRQELATAVLQPGGTVAITIVRPGATAGANESTPAWVHAPPPEQTIATTVELASGDLDGSADGKEELMVAVRYGSGMVVIRALNGTTSGGGAIAQASNTSLGNWTMPGSEVFGTTELMQLAAGDVLLEGRDQVVLLNMFQSTSYRFTVLRFEDVDSDAPGVRFNHRIFTQAHPNGGEPPARLTLHIGDFGGSAADEMLIHHLLQDSSGGWLNIVQTVRYFTTTRNASNAITNFALQPTATNSLRNVVSSSGNLFAAAIGEIDRRPNEDIVLARAVTSTPSSPPQLNVQVYKVGYDLAGFPASIGPAVGYVPAVVPLSADRPNQIELTVGDGDADGIGDVYAIVRDRASSAGPLLSKVRRFSLARPANPNEFPLPNTFALRSSFDFSTGLADTRTLRIDVADWDRDSLLANLGTTCARVQEPMVRSLVRQAPYWKQLVDKCCFAASFGTERSIGSGLETKFDTFTSHDISGYVGVSVGGEILGIGAEASVKVTAGYNLQATRGEIRTSEITSTVSQSQAGIRGLGLVIIEENTFDCYEYNVVRGGVPVPDSGVRSCELVRTDAAGVPLRTFAGTDPTAWDTVTAASGAAGRTPGQWAPLNQEWSSLMLFRPASDANVNADQVLRATDGRYDTALVTRSANLTFVQFDLGEVRDVANIRVFPERNNPAAIAALAGASLYLSEQPFPSNGLPSGPNVRVFPADPVLDNGAERWNVWTRSRTAPYAPVRARYIRLQHPSGSARQLRIAELQVFGDVLSDPPEYPLSVCDPVSNDGLYRARVFDKLGRVYRTIDMRGDMIWTGTGAVDPQCGSNHAGVKTLNIWDTIAIGGPIQTRWDLSDATFNATTDVRSITNSTRVGVELDLQAGAFVQALAGGAYQWETGATEEESSTIYWGESVNYGGEVPGFKSPAFDSLVTPCRYRTQPYGYIGNDRSNTGFTHQFTAVDYVVPNFNWDRLTNPPPASCSLGNVVPPPPPPPPPELVFANGFE
jgi:hypothetical protein